MAKKLSEAFEQAMDLFKIDPLPDDIIEKLDKLREKIPENELDMYDDLYDSLPFPIEEEDK